MKPNCAVNITTVTASDGLIVPKISKLTRICLKLSRGNSVKENNPEPEFAEDRWWSKYTERTGYK